MSLFPEEDVLIREIETWRRIIEKLPTDEDIVKLTKLLDSCYEYTVAMNNHAKEHPFPSGTVTSNGRMSIATNSFIYY
jgi:hypothetical protein